MKIKKVLCFVKLLTIVSFILLILTFTVNAAPTKPTLKGDPMNGQILPFYEVWLRWYDVSDEHHYTMTIRDLGLNGSLGDSGPLIYNSQYVAQNSTYFIVPTSKLTRGHYYRWCLNAYDSSGNRKIADAHYFAIESSTTDSHLMTYTYMTNKLEYFIYAESSGYDAILNQAAQNWNGIANVTLTRTATPTDGNYEVSIYESPSPSDASLLGRTITGLNSAGRVVNSEVRTYRSNIVKKYQTEPEKFYIGTVNGYFLANAMHEIGHALLLQHTERDLNDPNVYDLSKTISICGSNFVPLIMNDYYELGDKINVVDRDHLRIKWGE